MTTYKFSSFVLLFVMVIGLAFNLLALAPHDLEPIKAPSPPCTVVLFGASGDLTARKLIPALYHLFERQQLSKNTLIIGVARRPYEHEDFRRLMRQAIHFHLFDDKQKASWTQFEANLFYYPLKFDYPDDYQQLKVFLEELEHKHIGSINRLYYLATQPSYFTSIIENLNAHQLLFPKNHPSSMRTRVVIEKPFGHNLQTALQLHSHLLKHLDESQTYLIDHYLGKEGVQSLLDFRFKRGDLESFWNQKHIDHIQITLSEDIGVGNRILFWEETGALRDLLQNHVMQLLSILAMEPPANDKAKSLHLEKTRVLQTLRPFNLDLLKSSVIRGQYQEGTIRKEKVSGYREEAKNPHSSAETFVAAKLFIDNARWKDIPFYVRCGKRLNKQTTEIAIVFKKDFQWKGQTAPTLFIRIQPNPVIVLKSNEQEINLTNEKRDNSFTEAYERLLYDSICGNKSRFVSSEEPLAAWKLFSPVLDKWAESPLNQLHLYQAGSWGPIQAGQLFESPHHAWTILED